MHRVLQPLHELLDVCDSRLERPEAILSRINAGRLFRLIDRVGTVPDPADPCDQSIKLAHGSAPARTLGRNRAARIQATLFLRHLADPQGTVLDLLTHQFELRLALLLGPLPCALHLIASRVERSTRSCSASRSRARGLWHPGSRRTPQAVRQRRGALNPPSLSGAKVVRKEIRCVGCENLTGDHAARTHHRSTATSAAGELSQPRASR